MNILVVTYLLWLLATIGYAEDFGEQTREKLRRFNYNDTHSVASLFICCTVGGASMAPAPIVFYDEDTENVTVILLGGMVDYGTVRAPV